MHRSHARAAAATRPRLNGRSPAGDRDRSWRRVVLTIGAVALVISLDTTVNIAFPAITAAFTLRVSEIQWVVISYVLTYASLLLATGRLGDVVGHRRVLLSGLGLTAAGVGLCGLAPGFGLFLAARVVQGCGAALVLGAAPALVTLAAPESERSRALGGFQMGTALGLCIGPALGGLLLRWTSWRSVYLFRVPLALVLIAAVVVVVPSVPRPRGSRRAALVRELDIAGAAALAGGLASGLLAVSRVRAAGWGSPLVVAGLVAAAVLLTVWVRIERRGTHPTVDLGLFRHGPFTLANALNLVANGTMFAIWLLSPYYLIDVRGLSTVAGGLVLGASPLATALVAPLAGRLDGRVSTGRLCTLGLIVEAGGLAAVARVGSETPLLAVGAAFALVGAGLGLFTVPNLSYVMGSLERARQGVAGGLAQMTRTVGIVAGVAFTSLFFDARRAGHAARLAVPTADAGAFVAAFRDTFVLVAALCAVAAIVSALRPPRALA